METPEVCTYPVQEDGVIGLVIKRSSIIEYDDEIVPGIALTPHQARTVAIHLLQHANDIDVASGQN